MVLGTLSGTKNHQDFPRPTAVFCQRCTIFKRLATIVVALVVIDGFMSKSCRAVLNRKRLPSTAIAERNNFSLLSLNYRYSYFGTQQLHDDGMLILACNAFCFSHSLPSQRKHCLQVCSRLLGCLAVVCLQRCNEPAPSTNMSAHLSFCLSEYRITKARVLAHVYCC